MLISKKDGRSGVLKGIILVLAIVVLATVALTGCSDKDARSMANTAQSAADQANANAQTAGSAASTARTEAANALAKAEAAQQTANEKTTPEAVSQAIAKILAEYKLNGKDTPDVGDDLTTRAELETALSSYMTSAVIAAELQKYALASDLNGLATEADLERAQNAIAEYLSANYLNATQVAEAIKNAITNDTSDTLSDYMEEHGLANVDAFIDGITSQLSDAHDAAVELAVKTALPELRAAMKNLNAISNQYDIDEFAGIVVAFQAAEDSILMSWTVEDVNAALESFAGCVVETPKRSDNLYEKLQAIAAEVFLVDIDDVINPVDNPDGIAPLVEAARKTLDLVIANLTPEEYAAQIKAYNADGVIVDLEKMTRNYETELEALRIARDFGRYFRYELASVYDGDQTYYKLNGDKYEVVTVAAGESLDGIYIMTYKPVVAYIDDLVVAMKYEGEGENRVSAITKGDAADIANLQAKLITASVEIIGWAEKYIGEGWEDNPNTGRIIYNYAEFDAAAEYYTYLRGLDEIIASYEAEIIAHLVEIGYLKALETVPVTYEVVGICLYTDLEGLTELKNRVDAWAKENRLIVDGDLADTDTTNDVDDSLLIAVLSSYGNLKGAHDYATDMTTYYDAVVAAGLIEKLDALFANGMSIEFYADAVAIHGEFDAIFNPTAPVAGIAAIDKGNIAAIINNINEATFVAHPTKTRYDFLIEDYIVRMTELNNAKKAADIINTEIADLLEKAQDETLGGKFYPYGVQIEALKDKIDNWFTEFDIESNPEAEGFILANYNMIKHDDFAIIAEKFELVKTACELAAAEVIKVINKIDFDAIDSLTNPFPLYAYVGVETAKDKYYEWAVEYGVENIEIDLRGTDVEISMPEAYYRMVEADTRGKVTYEAAVAQYATDKTAAYTAFFVKFGDSYDKANLTVYDELLIMAAFNAANAWADEYIELAKDVEQGVTPRMFGAETEDLNNNLALLEGILTVEEYTKILAVFADYYGNVAYAEILTEYAKTDLDDTTKAALIYNAYAELKAIEAKIKVFSPETGVYKISIFNDDAKIKAIDDEYLAWVDKYDIDYTGANGALDTHLTFGADVKTLIDACAAEYERIKALAMTDFNTNVQPAIDALTEEGLEIYGNIIGAAKTAYKAWAVTYLNGDDTAAAYTDVDVTDGDAKVYKDALDKIATFTQKYEDEYKAVKLQETQTVADTIAALGTITFDSKEAIDAARAAYDKWLNGNGNAKFAVTSHTAETYDGDKYDLTEAEAALIAAEARWNTLKALLDDAKAAIDALDKTPLPDAGADPNANPVDPSLKDYQDALDNVTNEGGTGAYDKYVQENGSNSGITQEELDIIDDAQKVAAQQEAVYLATMTYNRYMKAYEADAYAALELRNNFTTAYESQIVKIREYGADNTEAMLGLAILLEDQLKKLADQEKLEEKGLTTIEVYLNVDSIAIKSEPTKLDYAAGDKLDLTGMVVTITFADASTKDINAVDFAAYGIASTPAGDVELVETNNGAVIEISMYNGVFTVTGTATLTVTAAVVTP